MTLFVTGAESFIGRALRAHCDAVGQATTGIDAAVPAGSPTRRADIRNSAIADLIPDGATVVHLAAISRDGDCRADPKAAFDVNVTGTLNLAAAAQKRGARQLIFASSEWVYGDVDNDEVQLESRPIDVTAMKSEYALSKIVAEQCLRLCFQLPAITDFALRHRLWPARGQLVGGGEPAQRSSRPGRGERGRRENRAPLHSRGRYRQRHSGEPWTVGVRDLQPER